MPKFLHFLLRIPLGGFFIWSGVVKLRDLTAFSQDITNYHLVPAPFDSYLAYFLPWLEIITGSLLALGLFSAGALTVIAGLMLIFIIALSSAWARGLNITCGCFGPSENPVNYPLKLTANAGILILATVMLIFPPAKKPS